MNLSARILEATPSALAPTEIADFSALVMAGGEVAAQGLEARISRAALLTRAWVGDALVGVAGLKHPSEHHREEVADGADIELGAVQFPYEIGWVFVLPGARGGGLSRRLCEPLVAAARGRGIFATSKLTNAPMHRTLRNLGFERLGSEWAARDGEPLVLLVRPAA